MMCFPHIRLSLAMLFGCAAVVLATPRTTVAQVEQPPSITPLPGLTPPPVPPRPLVPVPESVSQAVKQAVNQEFGAALASLQINQSTKQRWSNGCLNLARPDELCTQAIVPGYRIGMTDGVQTWFYRTDTTGQILRLEVFDRAWLPVPVAKQLVARVATDNPVPVANLRVTGVKKRVFDGCLGIYRPRQACTKIALQGWQAIVKGQRRTWVYHLNQDASRIEQNRAASGARTTVRTSFDLFGTPTTDLAQSVVFRRTVSGGLAGLVTTYTLTEDGNVTSLTTAPFIRSHPVVVKTLSPQQVKRFKRVLTHRRFPNLNGLSYLTEAALADYPTTSLQSQRGFVQYIDLEKPNLPRSLQRIILVWERLIQPAEAAS
ncbi:hypothetical protein IQ266_24255 [filamentous cyanobacterium LEGE 11480]|uniref:MucB/RseB N-terminal domain-containing protein n=1 Tax=Romeriopsis navalis LEGE 11480 TaxID=2777977 RepID=A0A928Z6P6_9CYAN|nr:hypothetical protein [Romeriopsis navalis]MBE9032853.1 hypothetical protein [Romeriopsis navalis LEGE 11480]